MEIKKMQTVLTQGISGFINANGECAAFLGTCWAKFVNKDWGDTCLEDCESNNFDILGDDGRVLAVYNIPEGLLQFADGEKSLWIIADDHVTFLFPSEY